MAARAAKRLHHLHWPWIPGLWPTSAKLCGSKFCDTPGDSAICHWKLVEIWGVPWVSINGGTPIAGLFITDTPRTILWKWMILGVPPVKPSYGEIEPLDLDDIKLIQSIPNGSAPIFTCQCDARYPSLDCLRHLGYSPINVEWHQSMAHRSASDCPYFGQWLQRHSGRPGHGLSFEHVLRPPQPQHRCGFSGDTDIEYQETLPKHGHIGEKYPCVKTYIYCILMYIIYIYILTYTLTKYYILTSFMCTYPNLFMSIHIIYIHVCNPHLGYIFWTNYY